MHELTQTIHFRFILVLNIYNYYMQLYIVLLRNYVHEHLLSLLLNLEVSIEIYCDKTNVQMHTYITHMHIHMNTCINIIQL